MESIVLGTYLWFKIYFLIDTNAKMWTEITDLVVLGRNYWSSCRVLKKLTYHLPQWFLFCVVKRWSGVFTVSKSDRSGKYKMWPSGIINSESMMIQLKYTQYCVNRRNAAKVISLVNFFQLRTAHPIIIALIVPKNYYIGKKILWIDIWLPKNLMGV